MLLGSPLTIDQLVGPLTPRSLSSKFHVYGHFCSRCSARSALLKILHVLPSCIICSELADAVTILFTYQIRRLGDKNDSVLGSIGIFIICCQHKEASGAAAYLLQRLSAMRGTTN
jgi:hypothetical protein